MANITVVGAGYVGLSNAVLLARHNEVIVHDVLAERVAMINLRQSPIEDLELEDHLRRMPLDLLGTLDPVQAYGRADIVLIATPTDYDPETNQFNTSTVERVIGDICAHNAQALVVIKSTVPVGLPHACVRSSTPIASCSRPNSCARAAPCTITFTPAASWWASAQSAPGDCRANAARRD